MSYVAAARRRDGWLTFAAVVMVIGGINRVIDAFWAFDQDDEIGDRMQTLLFDDDLAVYGWVWLIVGVLLIAAGFSVLGGAEWARWFGILMATIAAVSAMLWIYEFPIWSLVSILIAVLVIYGLTVYGGRDMADPD